MKKIMIATWCNNNGKTNYGQVLQAYALQKYLINKGHKVEIVNYINNIQYEKKSLRVRRFNRFVKKNINFSKLYRNIDELRKENLDYDVMIAGSDQIWNPANLNEIYLLKFGNENIKRISFASSGIFTETKENSLVIQKTAKELDGFDFVTVREKVSVEILEKYLKKRPELVCDPVFLLSDSEWSRVANVVEVKEKYIICYILGGVRNKQALLDNYRKNFGAEKVFVITSNLYEEKILWEKVKYIDDAGVGEFIYLIKNAEAVVTDSFHGTALSVIFKKQFINTKRYNEKENPYATEDRINSLYESLGIKTRKVKNVIELETLDNIEYDKLNKNLKEFIDKSKDFLQKAIS